MSDMEWPHCLELTSCPEDHIHSEQRVSTRLGPSVGPNDEEKVLLLLFSPN